MTLRPDHLSPSFGSEEESLPAFELKFLVDSTVAERITAWARGELSPDPNGASPENPVYDVTTLYLDTPRFGVFHGVPALGGAKHRVRRYSESTVTWLERKIRRGDTVRKRRCATSCDQLSQLLADSPSTIRSDDESRAAAAFFLEGVRLHALRPVCRLTYRRTAFFGASESGPHRLTLDREVRGTVEQGYAVARVDRGDDLLAGLVICELKFRGALPTSFKRLISDQALQPATASKYRRLVASVGLAMKSEPRDR